MGLSLALLAPLMQSGSASAQPILGLSKQVAVGTGTYGFSQNATPGSTLNYVITYSNTGNVAAPSLTIQDTLNAGQTLSYYSQYCSPSATSPVVVTCTIPNVPMNTSGSVAIGTTVNTGFSGTITNTAQASTTISGTTYVAGSNTTTVTVSGGPPPTPGVTLQKFVADSSRSGAYSTSINATVGDTLLYALQLTNNSGTVLPSVTISDALAPGQAYITGQYYANACNGYNPSTNTVSCTLTNVGLGTTTVYIETGVQNGYATIANQATATTGTTSVTSNSTYVTVSQATQYFTGSFTICGMVSSYVPSTAGTTGYLGFFGKTYTLAPGAIMAGQPITIGGNACFTFTTNTQGQIVAANVTPNLTGLNVVCGVYSTSGYANTIVLSGFTFGLNGTFGSVLVPGSYYCFVVDNAGTAYILLSNIPTAVTAPHFRLTPALRGMIAE